MKTLVAILAAFSLGAASVKILPAVQNSKPDQQTDNPRLKAIYAEDQSIREGEFTKLDWKKINKLDAEHRDEVTKMLKDGTVVTGTDYYHAAMVFQHASEKQGYKLAHELAMIGAAHGSKEARWLSAASWDRFLQSIKENQRFATQYNSTDGGKTFTLGTVDPEVTDAMRKSLDCPTLAQAKSKEDKIKAQSP